MSARLRVLIVYDCLFPWTVGGAERWYRRLAERLAEAGHEVSYATRRQWDEEDPPRIPGVRVLAVSPSSPLYAPDGTRRVGPPLRFGLGVFGHLLRNRRRYDVVHCSSFPFFSLLGARLALAGSPTRLRVDWLELWSRDYWRRYAGRLGGAIGGLVQAACVRLTPAAFAISPHTAERLRAAGLRGEVLVLPGLYSGSIDAEPVLEPPARPLVLFVGRLIAEKRASLLVQAVAAARRELPELRGAVLGDGPELEAVREEIVRLGLEAAVEAPGRVSDVRVEEAIGSATCLLLPSLREGYGMVVVEAAARGTPALVARAEDSAAGDLISEGENGFLLEGDDPETIAAAIVRAHAAGGELRRATSDWFRSHRSELSADAAAELVLAAYEGAPATAAPGGSG